MKKVDITGQKFGRLTVICRAENVGKSSGWLCKCSCGNKKVISLHHLRAGTKSCGCLSKEIASERGRRSKIGDRSRKHGDFGTKLYGVWAGMKRRCYNPNSRYYKDYGGRGIKLCDEWKEDYSTFKSWAISAGYSEGLSIDRIEVNGDYCPENCRWIPLSKQNSNKRKTIWLTYQGKDYTIKELAALTGIKPRTIQERFYRGLPIEEILKPHTRTIKKSGSSSAALLVERRS